MNSYNGWLVVFFALSPITYGLEGGGVEGGGTSQDYMLQETTLDRHT